MSSAIKEVMIDGFRFQIVKTQEGSETWNSQGRVTGYEVKYYAIGRCSKNAAMSAVLSDAEEYHNGLTRKSIKFDGVDDDGNYEFTISYAATSVTDSTTSTDESTLSFECGGGTKKVMLSIGEQRAIISDSPYKPGRNINWNGKTGDDSQIDGVEIPTAQMRETYTRSMELSQLSTAFRRRVAAMVGKVNDKKFKGWEKGEVMFLGCSFSGGSADGKITVSFNFSIQPNETVSVKDFDPDASGSATISKEGFEYAWTITRTEKGSGGDKVATKASVKGAWIAKVADYADFSTLGV